jgi:hypothetical protein
MDYTPVLKLLPLAAWLLAGSFFAQAPSSVKPYVSEDSPVLVLTHVRVIDGTGAAPMEEILTTSRMYRFNRSSDWWDSASQEPLLNAEPCRAAACR